MFNYLELVNIKITKSNIFVDDKNERNIFCPIDLEELQNNCWKGRTWYYTDVIYELKYLQDINKLVLNNNFLVDKS